MLEYRGAFLSRGALAPIVDVFASRYPIIFSRENLRVVGVDVAPQCITDACGEIVEPLDGSWHLHPGAYQMRFGFQVPKVLDEGPFELIGNWRSSNHRCAAGGEAIVWPEEKTEFLGGVLEEREVIGNYHVHNPFGIRLEKGAAVAQFSIKLRGAAMMVSELLKAKRVERFLGAGMIGKERTVLPPTESVALQNGSWFLKQGSPYYIEFDGVVDLGDEVLTPQIHLTDQLNNPLQFLIAKHSCLGDSGYRGPLGMTIVPDRDMSLDSLQGIARVASHRVLPFGKMAAYQGQWQGEIGDKRRIEFRPFYQWPELASPPEEVTLESLVAKLV